MINGFEIHNNKNIYCSGSQIQLQSTIIETDDENTLDLCYVIEPCAGDIFWSTKISYRKPTYTECTQDDARFRQDWLTMSDSERSLFIEGFQRIRDNGKLEVITESHSVNFMGRLHESSLFLYYHSYIIWETESAIRALGGKFSCFAMPFYDWTKDFGLEDDPTIFYTGIGGDGSENYCITVDGKDDTISNLFKTPNLCTAMEHSPNCCLKRLRDTEQQLVPLKKLRVGMKFKSGEQFDSIVRIGHAGFHRYFGAISDTHMHTGYASDDPIFHLAHSYMDLLRVVWQDCHEYTFEYSTDDGDVKTMENPEISTDMYHVYCYGGTENSITEEDDEHQTCEVLGDIIHLDDEMTFVGLGNADWTAVGVDKGAVTIRKIFNINPGTSWNVRYNVRKFYDDNLLLGTWCKGDRDEEVSMIWGEIHAMDMEDSGRDESYIGSDTIQAYVVCAVVMVLVIFIIFCVVLWRKYGCFKNGENEHVIFNGDVIEYGAFSI